MLNLFRYLFAVSCMALLILFNTYVLWVSLLVVYRNVGVKEALKTSFAVMRRLWRQ